MRVPSGDRSEPVLFDESEKFEGGTLWSLFATLPLGDEIDRDAEVASEDGLAGLFVLPDASYLAGGKRLHWSQAHLVEVTHGHLIHHPSIVKVVGCFMDGGEDRTTILPAHRRLLREHRF